MRMKKILCLLALILSVVCICACKSGGGNNNGVSVVTVTLDLDGGSIDGETVINATVWEDLNLPTPVKEGFDFKGWYYNGNHVTLKPFMLQEPAVTLIATWKERSYDVHLDFNGGYIVENGEEISRKNASATFGKPTDFPVPSKRGYDFVGWYYGEQEVSTSAWNLDVGTVIIKAVWDYKTYGVTFDFNGGTLVGGDESLTEQKISVKYNRTFAFPTLQKQGYSFVGWAFDGEEPLKTNLWTYEIDEPVLHAVFEPIKVNYVFDALGGTVLVEKGEINYGANADALKAVTALKAGYNFNGWKVAGETLASNFNYLPTANRSVVVLTADYSPKTYRLTLNASEGEISEQCVDVVFGVECDIPSPTPPEGYKFIGWKLKTTGEFVSSNKGKIVWNIDGEKELVARYSAKTYVNFINHDGSVEAVKLEEIIQSGGEAIPFPKDKLGYSAGWELNYEQIVALEQTTDVNVILTPNSYTVAFKNGTSRVVTKDYAYGRTVTLPGANDVKKNGHVLLGWSFDKDDQTDYISGTVVWNVAQPCEVYAVWKPITYTITYDVSSILADYTLYDVSGVMVSNVQTVGYGENYSLYTFLAKDNLISVDWLYNGSPLNSTGVWFIKENVTLTPKITYNNVEVEVNLNLNGGVGNTTVTFILGKTFKYISYPPKAPKGRKLTGYSYKGVKYSLDDLFLIVNYDGSPIKCLFEDVVEFTISIDVGDGTGESTAVIEYGKTLSSITPRPVAPNGKKLVGFLYNGVEYALSHVWEFSSYDGNPFIAIYVDDNVDWSPTV